MPAPDHTRDAAEPGGVRRAAPTPARRLAANARLAVTAIAIVLGLAFGIPWFVNLVWK